MVSLHALWVSQSLSLRTTAVSEARHRLRLPSLVASRYINCVITPRRNIVQLINHHNQMTPIPSVTRGSRVATRSDVHFSPDYLPSHQPCVELSSVHCPARLVDCSGSIDTRHRDLLQQIDIILMSLIPRVKRWRTLHVDTMENIDIVCCWYDREQTLYVDAIENRCCTSLRWKTVTVRLIRWRTDILRLIRYYDWYIYVREVRSAPAVRRLLSESFITNHSALEHGEISLTATVNAWSSRCALTNTLWTKHIWSPPQIFGVQSHKPSSQTSVGIAEFRNQGRRQITQQNVVHSTTHVCLAAYHNVS